MSDQITTKLDGVACRALPADYIYKSQVLQILSHQKSLCRVLLFSLECRNAGYGADGGI